MNKQDETPIDWKQVDEGGVVDWGVKILESYVCRSKHHYHMDEKDKIYYEHHLETRQELNTQYEEIWKFVDARKGPLKKMYTARLLKIVSHVIEILDRKLTARPDICESDLWYSVIYFDDHPELVEILVDGQVLLEVCANRFKLEEGSPPCDAC